jgi:hypothetical protein
MFYIMYIYPLGGGARVRPRAPHLSHAPGTSLEALPTLIELPAACLLLCRFFLSAEYEPESSAPVGRRWAGTNLGRLYEHVLPSVSPPASRSPSRMGL